MDSQIELQQTSEGKKCQLVRTVEKVQQLAYIAYQGRIQAIFEIGNCFWAHKYWRPNFDRSNIQRYNIDTV